MYLVQEQNHSRGAFIQGINASGGNGLRQFGAMAPWIMGIFWQSWERRICIVNLEATDRPDASTTMQRDAQSAATVTLSVHAATTPRLAHSHHTLLRPDSAGNDWPHRAVQVNGDRGNLSGSKCTRPPA
jgi:hypothetical protein